MTPLQVNAVHYKNDLISFYAVLVKPLITICFTRHQFNILISNIFMEFLEQLSMLSIVKSILERAVECLLGSSDV